MYLVTLKFAENKDRVQEFLEAHKAWLNRGFEEGVFLLAGSLQPDQGGAILANNVSKDELQARVNQDPFVAENVVYAEIMEISPSIADDRLQFLCD